MRDYLIQRFLRSNHKKYHKYVFEWIDNLTETQLQYFKLEKDRIEYAVRSL